MRAKPLPTEPCLRWAKGLGGRRRRWHSLAALAAWGWALAAGQAVAAESFQISSVAVTLQDGGAEHPGPFQDGETLYLRFRVLGAKPKLDENDDASISLRYKVSLLDQFGQELARPQSEELQFQLDEKDKNWAPTVRLSFVLPQGLVAGTGEFVLVAEDLIAKSSFTAKEPVALRGPKIANSGLAVQDVRFARNEQGPWRPDLSEFDRGTTAWCRFLITGFALGPQKNFAVSYVVELQDAGGKTLYKQEPPSELVGADGYPRRYTEAWFGHNFPDSGFQPGAYSFLVTITDQIAAKTITLRREFTVK